MNNIEILAPAGSAETVYAAINAGADAVYIGGQKFGARAYAENPEDEHLLKAIDYVHLKGKKIYLTVNTLLKNQELEEQLYNFLLPFYNQGLDAVIVQDMGVFDFIKDNFPDIDIHASTQMGVSGVYSAKLLKELGASRVVTARELSLMEIRDIYENVDIEIESFIHGAMCYSYSGMCLFSSMAGGRSGNRGRCAGPCRQPYEVYENGKRLNENNSLYALSLKDMNTLHILPEIIDAGVYSLKIEGRMKSPEYSAGVVSIYRKYLDMYYSKGSEGFKIDKKDDENLANLYTRSGSGTGYYKKYNSPDMVSYFKPSYESKDDDFVRDISEKYCNGPDKIKATAYINLMVNEAARLDVVSGECYGMCIGEKVGEAVKRPLDNESIIKQLSKTGDSFFEFDKIEINADNNIFMPVKHLNELRRDGIKSLSDNMLKKYRRDVDKSREKNPADIKTYDYDSTKTHVENNVNISCQVCTMEQAEAVVCEECVSDIYISTDYLSVDECVDIIDMIPEDKGCYIIMPYIFRDKGIKYMDRLLDNNVYDRINGLLVRNIDELAYVISHQYDNFIIDSSMYSFNDRAYNFYKNKGAKRVTIPYELNYKEMKSMKAPETEVVVYGNIPLMISSNCVNQNFNSCDKITKEIILKDRLNYRFAVNNCCNFCYNIIYNMSPLSLISVSDRLKSGGFKYFRINFTTEKGKEVVKIIDKCRRAFYNNEKIQDEGNITRGHFKRGVE